MGFSPILSLTLALWQPSAIHNGTPKFLMNDILLDFPALFSTFHCTVENNTQTSLIFSHKAADRGFSRSKNHLSDPCANGRGSGVEDWIEDWRWGGGCHSQIMTFLRPRDGL